MNHISFCWIFTWFTRMTSSKYKIKDSGVFVRPLRGRVLFDSYDLLNFTSLNFRFRLVVKNLQAHKFFLKFQISNFSCYLVHFVSIILEDNGTRTKVVIFWIKALPKRRSWNTSTFSTDPLFFHVFSIFYFFTTLVKFSQIPFLLREMVVCIIEIGITITFCLKLLNSFKVTVETFLFLHLDCSYKFEINQILKENNCVRSKT